MRDPRLERRINRVQRTLGIRSDGIVGPITISALEHELGIRASTAQWSLTVSKKGLSQLVRFEITSEAYYRKNLQAPYWPGGQSGVTVGIGYDLGTETAAQISKDFSPHLSDDHVLLLQSAAGTLGPGAEALAAKLKNKNIRISLDIAQKVFQESSLPSYAEKTRKVYPGVQKLPADAQAMLLSLVYNRGTSLSGDKRKEMKEIVGLVKKQDLTKIADQILAMKRLWDKDKLPGLHKRRDVEAEMVRKSERKYDPKELVHV